MAGPNQASQARVTPERIAEWAELVLFLADKLLRLFGRRKSDRPARAEPDEGPRESGSAPR
jgi:hypothetical protein